MSGQTKDLHRDNATPQASDDDIKRMDGDTPYHGEQSTGASARQGVRTDLEEGHDPKSGGTPVHPAPSEERPNS